MPIECRPRHVDVVDHARWSPEQIRAGAAVDAYLDGCACFVRDTFAVPADAADVQRPVTETVDAIVRILLRAEFHYQSTGRVAHLLPALRDRLTAAVRAGQPLPVYFLYHGGYRASSQVDCLTPVFAPDATELLLLFQAARFQRRVQAVYPPGVSFAIVINNGVAAYTNDIPYPRTEAYVAHLERLIAALGADAAVWVLTQSTTGDFQAHMAAVDVVPATTIDPVDHAIVERFLGRRCAAIEACFRIAHYVAAETAWARLLAPRIDAASGFFVRQVAHPACLSFRPFPGGATRVQNGTVGFRISPAEQRPLPFLISARTAASRPIADIPVRLSAIVPHGFAPA